MPDFSAYQNRPEPVHVPTLASYAAAAWIDHLKAEHGNEDPFNAYPSLVDAITISRAAEYAAKCAASLDKPLASVSELCGWLTKGGGFPHDIAVGVAGVVADAEAWRWRDHPDATNDNSRLSMGLPLTALEVPRLAKTYDEIARYVVLQRRAPFSLDHIRAIRRASHLAARHVLALPYDVPLDAEALADHLEAREIDAELAQDVAKAVAAVEAERDRRLARVGEVGE